MGHFEQRKNPFNMRINKSSQLGSDKKKNGGEVKAVMAGKFPQLHRRGESGFLASVDLLFSPLNQCVSLCR